MPLNDHSAAGDCRRGVSCDNPIFWRHRKANRCSSSIRAKSCLVNLSALRILDCKSFNSSEATLNTSWTPAILLYSLLERRQEVPLCHWNLYRWLLNGWSSCPTCVWWFHRIMVLWCEALSLKISPWRARRAKSALPTQKSTFSFFSPFAGSKTSFRRITEKHVPIAYLCSSWKNLRFLENQKSLNRCVRKFCFVAEKFMFVMNGLFSDFRHWQSHERK